MPAEPLFRRLASTPEVLIEQPRWSIVKRRGDGRIDFVSPLPCPYNYGSIPAVTAADGDALDAVVLGPRLGRGRRLCVPVVGVIGFIDAGRFDPKVICSACPLEPAKRVEIARFFAGYAWFKRILSRIRREAGPTRSMGFLPESAWRDPGGGSNA